MKHPHIHCGQPKWQFNQVQWQTVSGSWLMFKTLLNTNAHNKRYGRLHKDRNHLRYPKFVFIFSETAQQLSLSKYAVPLNLLCQVVSLRVTVFMGTALNLVWWISNKEINKILVLLFHCMLLNSQPQEHSCLFHRRAHAQWKWEGVRETDSKC